VKKGNYQKSLTTVKTYIDNVNPSLISNNQIQVRLVKSMQYMSHYETLQEDIELHENATTEMHDDRIYTDELH